MGSIPVLRPFGSVFDHTLRECANCLIFNWGYEDESLQRCSRCKVLVYCDKQCQQEHWRLVHKHHCKKMAMARTEEERTKPELTPSSVTIYSHHPFPKDGVGGDIYEGLVLSVGQIIAQMRSTRHPACSTFKNDIESLEMAVIMAQRRIWYDRKVYPPNFHNFPYEELLGPFNRFTNNFRMIYVKPSKKKRFAKLDLWSTLLLFTEQIQLMALVEGPKFKGGDRSMEQSDFLKRMGQLAAAHSTQPLPSFAAFINILCGGSAIQKCSFCSATTAIEALAWSGKGQNQQRHSTVVHKPNTPLVFCCRRQSCSRQLKEKSLDIIERNFSFSIQADQVSDIKCDYCFLLSPRVHRSMIYFKKEFKHQLFYQVQQVLYKVLVQQQVLSCQ